MTRHDAMRRELVAHARARHRPTAAQAFHDVIVTDLRSELSRITAPLTMLFAMPAHWPAGPAEFEAALRASFAGAPHARLVRVDESGHAIHLDQPGRVAEVIRELLAR